MPALEPFYHLLDAKQKRVSKNEVLLIEIILFLQLEYALNKIIRTVCAHEKNTHDTDCKEHNMIESNFVRNLIEDILSTEEYTLSGIAFHLQVPEEVLSDILIGYNQSPSLVLARKIMELHKCVRRDLYQYVVKKIVSQATRTNLSDELA